MDTRSKGGNGFDSYVTYDEYGRPFIILKEQNDREQITGPDVLKSHILAAKAVTSILKSSFGPKGLDKAMISPDGDLTITNDGATILAMMDVDHAIAKLLVELSACQDNEIGDGTTGVVVLTGALIEEVESLIAKGIHPIRIADGFELAAHHCLKHIDQISEEFGIERNAELLKKLALTTLRSKIVSKCAKKFADIAVEAVLSIADLKNKVIDLERIRIIGKPGGSLENTVLVKGMIIEQDLSHPQMQKELINGKVVVAACGLELPRPKIIKMNLELKSKFSYNEAIEQEQEIYEKMINKIRQCNGNFVVCQEGIEEMANQLLVNAGIVGIRYAAEREIQLISAATNSKIVSRFEDLTDEKVGFAGHIREMKFGTENDRFVVFENCVKSDIVTVLIRGGNELIIEEAKRSLHDAFCMVKNLILDNKIVYGGGSSELSCAIAISKEADKISTLEQYSFRAFADALESIPMTLAANCGYPSIQLLSEIKARQVNENNPFLGIDCMQQGTCDMKAQNVIETARSKKQQILSAMQVVKQFLKIDEVRAKGRGYGKHEGTMLY